MRESSVSSFSLALVDGALERVISSYVIIVTIREILLRKIYGNPDPFVLDSISKKITRTALIGNGKLRLQLNLCCRERASERAIIVETCEFFYLSLS